MEFYKKLKATRPVINEGIASTLVDIERKIGDMQPVIQDPTSDKSKVQKTIVEIKAQVDSLKSHGGTITPEQQERIKEVTRKYNEISVKHSYITDVNTSSPSSPRGFRKRVIESKEMVQQPQNKVVFQHQVEETLKAMRQKRLDRLSIFVAEQSRLSEERSNKNDDSNEMEDAIRSIQKTDVETKANFRTISEESVTEPKVIKEKTEEVVISSPKLGRSRSNESDKFKNSKSSTLRLINKFNCTVPSNSSSEDLTDVYSKVESTKDKTESSPETYFTSKPNETYTHAVADDLEVANVLLSPRGKQRKAVYMYDHECQFLETEKRSSLPPLSTFGKEIGQETKKGENKRVVHTYENAKIVTPKQATKTQNGSEDVRVVSKKNHGYENSEIQLQKPEDSKSRECKIPDVSRRSLDNTCDLSKNRENVTEVKGHIKTDAKTEDVNNKGDSDKRPPKLVIKSDLPRRKLNRNLENSPHSPLKSPLKSPMPFPRRHNHAERILKKVQRNWESLNEILENDSDVDCDEIEDLKNTYEEANLLLNEYKTKISRLDRKSKEVENTAKLVGINVQLDEIEEEIDKFKGLKRDRGYMQLSSRLSNYFLDVSKVNCSNNAGVNTKENTLKKIDRNIKKLESKVVKNESMLMEVLDMQVKSIGTNCLCITKV